MPGAHSDEPYNDITIVIYSTPNLPFDCGTSFWQHRPTGLTNPATVADAKRLKVKLIDLQLQLEKESKQRKKWLEIDRLVYRFSRMLASPSRAFHSATKHYGKRNTTMADNIKQIELGLIGVPLN